MKNVRSVFWVSMIVSLLGLAPLSANAMGISPALWRLGGILPNTSISRTVYLTRSDPSEDELGQVFVYGPAAKYVRLPNKGIVKLPKGTYNTKYEFFVEPGTLGAGDYEAKIRVAPYIPPRGTNEPGGAGVIAGAQAVLRFSVTTTAAESYSVSNSAVNSTEEDQILDFSFLFHNTGNVDARPTKIEVTIHDNDDPSFVYEEEIPAANLKITKALTTEPYDVPTKAKLGVGKYTMEIEYYQGNLPVAKSNVLPFNVYPRGSLAQKGELMAFTSNKKAYDNGEFAVFKGTFSNSGKVGLTATLTINISRGSQVVEVLSTDPTFVPVGQSFVFEKSYRLQDSGSYSAVASVSFLPYQSRQLRVNFTVGSKLSLVWTLPLLALILILIILLIWFIARRRSRELPPYQPTSLPPTSPPPTTPPTNPQPPSVGL